MRGVLIVGLLATLVAAVPPTPPSTPAPSEKWIKPEQWFAEHKATSTEFDGDMCSEITVGPSREPALLCHRGETGGNLRAPGYWLETRLFASVVRAGKITTVIDVAVSLMGYDSGWPPLILQLELSADGKSAALVDRHVTASRGEVADRDLLPGEACGTDPSDVFLRRLCKGRGTYRWNGKRYVRSRR